MIEDKPVRKIGTSAVSLTGNFASEKNDYGMHESSLERDFMYMLELDFHVSKYVVQPVKIEYLYQGKKRSYVPDFKVHYKASMQRTTIFEVKYRDDLRRNWEEYKPKFRAAIIYCKKNRIDFRIITEREIRTDFLKNAKFLSRYRKAEINPVIADKVMWFVKDVETATPQFIIDSLCNSKIDKAMYLYTVWSLIQKLQLKADLNFKLDMNSTVWI